MIRLVIIVLSVVLGMFQSVFSQDLFDQSTHCKLIGAQLYHGINFQQTYQEPPMEFKNFLLFVAIHNKRIFYEVSVNMSGEKNQMFQTGPVPINLLDNYKKDFFSNSTTFFLYGTITHQILTLC